jgi:hypothetical protein
MSENSSTPPLVDSEVGQRLFQIRMADEDGARSSAKILVNKMYSTRGYFSTGAPEAPPSNRITLLATDKDQTIGTMTLGYDGPEGLLVDALFGAEMRALRDEGLKVCEFTKLAMDNADPTRDSKTLLASLFHVAHMYSHFVMGCDRLVIEVNPRHVAFYRRMLRFVVIGPERLNTRVNAPAVLLSMDLNYGQTLIEKFAGHADLYPSERSLYPRFFNAKDEEGIRRRLTGAPAPGRLDAEPVIPPTLARQVQTAEAVSMH